MILPLVGLSLQLALPADASSFPLALPADATSFPLALPADATSLALTGAPSPRSLVWRDVVEPHDKTEQAAAAFAEGEQAYAAGDFEAAALHFGRAQELVPHPFTAYNLGLAQARAGRTLAAWETFDRLARAAADPEHRADAAKQRARLRQHVAFVRVDAPFAATVCLDGDALPGGTTRTVLPGPHRVVVDGATTDVELRGGETQQLQIRGSEQRPAPRAVGPLLGVAIGSGIVAMGTGLGPLFTNDRNAQIGLGLTAAAAASLAVGTAIAALVLHSRHRARSDRSPPASCPAG